MKRLYCGHENAIEVLDISAPGYDSSERLKTTQSRGDKGGQKGTSQLSRPSHLDGERVIGIAQSELICRYHLGPGILNGLFWAIRSWVILGVRITLLGRSGWGGRASGRYTRWRCDPSE